MTLSAGAEFSAPILDALGKHEAAEMLRWRQDGPDLAAELDEANAAAEQLEAELDDARAELLEVTAERDALRKAMTKLRHLAAQLSAGWDSEPNPDPTYVAYGQAFKEAARRINELVIP